MDGLAVQVKLTVRSCALKSKLFMLQLTGGAARKKAAGRSHRGNGVGCAGDRHALIGDAEGHGCRGRARELHGRRATLKAQLALCEIEIDVGGHGADRRDRLPAEIAYDGNRLAGRGCERKTQ